MTRIFSLAALIVALFTAPLAAFEIDAMSDEERDAFRAEVRAYLLDNPEVILEAVQILEQRQREEAVNKDAELVAAHRDEVFNDGYSHVGGNPDGDVTVVEFLDYRCGYCRKAHPEFAQLLESDGNIRWIIKEFPILGEDSTRAARFAIATRRVAGPEAYMAVHNALMEMQGKPDDVALRRLAESLGLDADAIFDAMNAPEVDDEIRRNRELARALNINGTPTFIFGEHLVRGYVPLDTMEQIVSAVRESG